MTITAVTASRPWLLVGWTMLHFLWVGGLLGLAAAALRRALRGARPEVRYSVAMLGLAALAVAPAVIASLLFMASQPAAPRNLLTESPATSQVEATVPLMIPRESVAAIPAHLGPESFGGSSHVASAEPLRDHPSWRPRREDCRGCGWSGLRRRSPCSPPA